MTITSAGEPSMNSSDRESDNLMAIKGIGPARQRWLKETLKVRTFRELAALSADDIETRLKADGQVASRNEIDRWLAQAQALAAVAEPTSPRVVVGAAAESGEEANAKVLSPGVKVVNLERGGKDFPPVEEHEWKPFASFVVEFQTRQLAGGAEEQRTKAHYMEADKEASWPGLEGKQLCQWMLNQLSSKKLTEPEEKPQPAATPAMTAKITQIQVFQPPQVETPLGLGRAGQPFSGIVRRNEPFALEVSFDLVGAATPVLAKEHVMYRAQFHAHSMTTGADIRLGDARTEALVEGQLAYTATLPTATLPKGVYRLRTLVMFQTASATPGYLEVPFLPVA